MAAVQGEAAKAEGDRSGGAADPAGQAAFAELAGRLRLDPRYASAARGLVFRKPPDLRVRWDRE